ncbi:MAG: division/cell wall cluster transcriptional repressor MraZ, partial [Planctomycetes bacterium]|nr:division/cell wall cluster transcriptional repressor MraZ [Planctomycetota bacterium]
MGPEWTDGGLDPAQGGEFVFCGESTHSVDAKKRVFVPKRFQQGLPLDAQGQRAGVLSRGTDGCLYLFSERAFNRALQRLNTEAYASKKDLLLQRKIFSVSERMTLDGSGRLLLPSKLAAMAGIDKEVVMVGVMDRIEIWAPERWSQFQVAEDGGDFDELENLLSGGLR